MQNKKTSLVRFKVDNFRSIEKSDWIDASDNSCLIGTNESGKTNLLIALWKLNPVNNEPIIPLDDFPRLLFSNYVEGKHEFDVFISADFLLNDRLRTELADELGCESEQIKTVLVERQYNGEYKISFPYTKIEQFESERLSSILNEFWDSLKSNEIYTKEGETTQLAIDNFIIDELGNCPTNYFDQEYISTLIHRIEFFNEQTFGKKKKLPEYFNVNLLPHLTKILSSFNKD